MAIHKKSEHLFLVDLDQKLRGFRQFISCWVYKKNNTNILIDPGPTSTIPVLEKALAELNILRLDYILLTHIHIDHAGGTGLLTSKFPEAKVICHPKGIQHMINPESLWQGSLTVLGKIAETYKPIVPIPSAKIFYESRIDGQIKIDVFETPGHAMHHLNFLLDGYLFSGEVAGVNFPLEKDLYLRIATPPRFIYEIYKDSLYMAAGLECDEICFGHYDMRSDVGTVFDAAKEQLELWMETTQSFYNKNKFVNPDEIFENLLIKDRFIKSFVSMEKDIQEREKYFALNSIKGMLDYIKRSKNINHNQ